MATSRSVIYTLQKLRSFSIHRIVQANLSISCSSFAKDSSDPGYTKDPNDVFFNSEVQTLLQRLTGQDHEKIFRKRNLGEKLEPPKIELLTEEEVDRLMAEAEERMIKKLQMPPLLKEKADSPKILAKNPEIQGFDSSNYVFIDISEGIPDRYRTVVVREPEGILREANKDEKHRMCQIYFPAPGRELSMPKMFEEEYLSACLQRGDYEFVLDRACTQFEPDDSDYIRVTRKTYDHIDMNKQYEVLRSTRHFGPLTLHLVLSKRMDDLMLYFLSKQDLSASADLVRLFHKVETDRLPPEADEHKLIEDYINEHALKKANLQLAWDTLLEIEKQRYELENRSSQSS
nr:EOG090X0AW0 [Macrothrix elegans]